MRQVETASDLTDQATMAGMTGLEFMRGVLDGTLAGAPIARTMDFDLHAVSAGRVTFRGAPGFAHMNPMGTIHGGWYGTILDSALGCAVMTTLKKGTVYTTLEYKVNIVRSIPEGMEVDAIAEAVHVGRSTSVATAEIRGVGNDKLYATGSTTCIIMAAP